MRLNPIPFIIWATLLVVLIWSGGHAAWLVILLVFTVLIVWATKPEVK